MSHESSPLISVIVAVFNGVKTLQQCIDSVAQQTYPNKELIIIDGGSKDGSVDLLETNSGKISYWISEPDCGIYNAWNKGLAQAHGVWICFLGADDYFRDALVLERLTAHLVTIPPNIRVAYGQIMLLNDDGENLYPIGEPWEMVKERFKQVMCVPHPGLMHRRSFFEQHGNFDESFSIAGDYELLLRELKLADAFFIPNIITVAMQQGGISSDPENSLVQLREVRRAQRIHGQYLPGWLWLLSMARVYMRLFLWRVFGEKLARKALDFGRRMMGLPPCWTKAG
jgi:glycosyltransferase involved in cell wall biosynthesis